MSGGWLRLKLRKSAGDVDRAVRFMIRHAARHVPFYRDAWHLAGVRPSEIRGAADLPRLPLTAREDLLLSGAARFLHGDAGHRRLVSQHTTGTTGTPVVVHMSRVEARFRTLTLLDSFRRNAKLALPMTIVDVGPQQKDRATRPVLRAGLVTVVRLFSSTPLEEQIDILQRHRPTLIEGRPSTLWALAKGLQVQGIRPHRPKLLVSFAEVLFPHVRTLLGEVFDCRVVDYYNCEEVGNLAWECPLHPDTMHVNTSTAWVEVVGANGEPLPYGAIGEVVVTNLYNATMPFVRYALRDRASLLEPALCACGYEGPSMRLLEGRDEDFFVLPDGREISPRAVYAILNGALPVGGIGGVLARSLLGLQIVQESSDLVVVRVIPGPEYAESIWAQFEHDLLGLCPSLRVQVRCVDSLESGTPGTKFRSILSCVHGPWQALRMGEAADD